MIILDIILWVGVQSPKMTFPVPNDEGGWGHQLGKKSPKAILFFFQGVAPLTTF